MGRYPKGYWLDEFPQYNFIISGDTGLQVSDVLSDWRRAQEGGDHICFMYQLESVVVQHHSRCFCKRGVHVRSCCLHIPEVDVRCFLPYLWTQGFSLNPELTNLTKPASKLQGSSCLSSQCWYCWHTPLHLAFDVGSGGWVQVLMLALLYRLSDLPSSAEGVLNNKNI